MLKELIHLWKHRGIMMKAVDTFAEMLDDCTYVFEHSWVFFAEGLASEKEKQDIHERDRMVNTKERQIRRLLVEHLTMNPGQDASGCLALMSMVKDAERIGDYSKNIFDLASMTGGNMPTLRHLDDLRSVQQRIETSLKSLKSTFIDSDEERAKQILHGYLETKEVCNKVLQSLFREELPKQEALVTVLLARYLKRVNSHVSNVASGIIYPLDKIDFVRGGLLE